jgi:hypothetical protein
MSNTIAVRPQDREPKECRYALAPGVILFPVEEEGTARLLDMNRNFYAVSATGTRMLQSTLARGAVAAAQEIAEECGVALDRVQTDLDAFLSELQKRHIIDRSARSANNQHSRIVDRIFLTLPLRLIDRWLRSWKMRASALLLFARFSVHVFGWTRTIAALTQYHPMSSRSAIKGTKEKIATAVNDALSGSATVHFIPMNCKERSLCCWTLARWAGLPAILVVGISLVPLCAHCWCEVGSLMLGDNPENCKQYTPVTRYA